MSKQKVEKEHVRKTSADVRAERVAALRELFPEAVTEGKVDFDRLREALGDAVDERAERYSFSWAGRREAIRLLQSPSRAALVPVNDEAVEAETTNNLFIEGDNLEVLKLLYKSYAGRVRMIYIDPPYNTGSDFIYPDNFRDPLASYLKLTRQRDAEGNLLTSNPEKSGRYHSAWLSMMYPRLFVARALLREDGVIFISIDDHELHNLRMIMNELFGEENFVAQIEWQKRYTRSNNTDGFTSVIDHILVYARSASFRPNLFEREREANRRYANPDRDPRGPWKATPFLNQVAPRKRPNLCYEIVNPNTGERTLPDKKAWRSERSVFERLQKEGRLWWGKDGKSPVPDIKTFLSEVRQGMTPINFWDYGFAGHTDAANAEIKELFEEKVFDTPKPSRLIRRMLEIATSAENADIILDFFAGSCTTAHAVLEQNQKDGGNRRFIMVQLPEPTGTLPFSTIAEIGKERIRRVIGKLRGREGDKLKLEGNEPRIDLGFRVFKLNESCFHSWQEAEERDPQAYVKAMELYLDPLVPGWKPVDVIWEVALKEGYGLNSRITHLSGLESEALYRVIDHDLDQSFYICLDDEVSPDIASCLNLQKDDLLICRDAALTDETAANLALQCRTKFL